MRVALVFDRNSAVPSIDELERVLQRDWDLEALSVYADALIAVGDPRGELIALDMAIASGNPTAEILKERDARVQGWLDSVIVEESLSISNVRLGFLEDVAIQPGSAVAERLHHAGVGLYLRSVNISADAVELPSVLAGLVAQPLPWLRRLSIYQRGIGPLPRATVDAFAQRAPNLTELILDGDHVMVTPGHPNVATLRISGPSSIVVGPEPMPAVKEIDLAFDRSGRRAERAGPGERAYLAGLVNPRAFPSLCRLDLARNEFAYPTRLECNVGVFPFVDAIENPARITHFRLPSLRNADDVAGVRALLDREPHRTVDVARMYSNVDNFIDGLEDPRLALPSPRPWPPRDAVSGRSALTIRVPNHRYGDDVALSTWIETLEYDFDDFTREPRSAWVQLWAFLDDLAWESPDGQDVVRPFPAAKLLAALETMDDHRSQAVSEKLKALTPSELASTEVTIERYWGW